jgi:hypothetical protein
MLLLATETSARKGLFDRDRRIIVITMAKRIATLWVLIPSTLTIVAVFFGQSVFVGPNEHPSRCN